MKSSTLNLLKTSFLTLLIIFTAASCRRNKTPKNYFKIGEQVYEITYGVIINNGEADNGFNVDLRLYDQSRNNFLNFSVISKQAESLANTTYTNFEGSWILGYKDNGSYSSMASINTGSVVINRSSDGYSIDIKCTDQYNTEIEGYFKGELDKKDEDNFVKRLPNYVLPNDIYDEVTKYLPIHSGVNPPDMEGEYVSKPHALIYESYAENPDSVQFYSDRYLGFIYTNKQMNFYGRQYDSLGNKNIEEIQYGVKITGSNDYFTCYYIVDGYVEGYYAQQSFIFSGKKTDAGLEDFHVGVILLETSGNPNMYAKHSYRVLKDYDGLAKEDKWLSGRNNNNKASVKINNSFDIWMK